VSRAEPKGSEPGAVGHPGRFATELASAPVNADAPCLHAAVVIGPGGKRTWFPCRSHEGSTPERAIHHYAAHWPACPAPWCRLPYSHFLEGTMHDIPSGTVEYHDHAGAVKPLWRS
jgi:hypothetical protein